jgi:hypothetical protein
MSNQNLLDTVLLLALPASGKSEVRKYMRQVPAKECEKDFHMGETVQLDDFPYVHIARRIDEELVTQGQPRLFFLAPDRSFQDPLLWGALIQLLNEDYEDLLSRKVERPASAGAHLMERIDRACANVGAKSRLTPLSKKVYDTIASALENEAREMLEHKHKNYRDSLDGKTIVLEFARGGAHGSDMPLRPPFGYGYSISQLSEKILKRSAILYIWVTPEESRRKNQERADPNDPGSILHHSVPLEVMMNDYGCDDMDWLEANSKVKGTVTLRKDGKSFVVPIARFDNRSDKTSFLRGEKNEWKAEDVRALHDGLKDACARLSAKRTEL